VDYNGKLDVEEFIDQSIVSLASAGETSDTRTTFNSTFDLLNEAHGSNALRRFSDGQPTGRVLLAAYECIAVGIARNITSIQARSKPVEYVRRRIAAFWKEPAIGDFFAAGLRGTVRIQRTIPFGTKWFAK